MTLTARRRRTVDRSVAAFITVVVVVTGLIIYLNSDIRATTDSVGPSRAVPTAPKTVPTALAPAWSGTTDASLGAVVSPSGVVVTADQHTVTAHDSVTGAVRWSYSRSNVDLCAVGSGDQDNKSLTAGNGVRGIATVYEKNGFCSQVMTLDPVTGARSKVRTSPLPVGGSLVFGGSYAGWLGSDLVEVWRYDLLRTSQYGNQPNPTQPNTQHLGCTFTDLALADTQFGTIEHCSAQGPHARVVLNFDDPGAVDNHPSGWDQFKHSPRMDVDTGSNAARIVGITTDRVAVLVSSPKPAVVIYDAAGKEVARDLVNIPAEVIVASVNSGGVTPAVRSNGQQISLIGSYLLAVSTVDVQGPAPATSLTSLLPTTTSAAATSAASDVDLESLQVDWTTGSSLGLPAVINGKVLMPVTTGLQVFSAETGPSALGAATSTSIKVDRSGYAGRVDTTAVGTMIVEVRGKTVVALHAS